MPVIAFGGPAFGLGGFVFGAGLRIIITNTAIDDDAVAGATIGAFSIIGNDGSSWTYSLTDDAGGQFAISDSNLVVGVTALDHDTAPSPSITVLATDGIRTVSGTFAVNVRRPLPSLPLAAGAKVVGLGHSFIQRGGWGILSGGKARDLSTGNARGVLPWIRVRDNRFNLDMWHDLANNLGTDNYVNGAFQGVGGDHIVAESGAPGVIERLPYVIARGPGIIYLDIGTNDISSAPGASVALVSERLDRLLTLCRNEGVWTVIQTVTDRGSWPDGSEKTAIVYGVNEWIKSQAGRDGVRVCDLTASGFNYPMFDTTLLGGDVLHPNPKGGERMATVLLPILQDMVSPGDHMDLSDATVLGASNLWTDAVFAASATSSGTGTSGDRVSTMGLGRQSGDSNVALSIEAAEGYNKQVMVFTPSGTMSGNRYEEWRYRKTGSAITLASLGIVPGTDWLEAGVYVELSPWDGWLTVQWQFEFYDASQQQYIARGGLGNPDRATQDLPFATEGFAGWLTIPSFQIPADVGATNWTAATRPLIIEINRRVTGTGTLKVSKPFLRKRADPRPVWNLVA
ncbi:hypothetical protein ACO34A_03790 [Rhizobium sp. ACO-34A]|nr:GDSL-type esterase/lipase family protein [Rhizobium sp. ACO-34A]ATN32922.1 hypothetical protein ACO34A_03790 [Rhizobium sp. ACO-34A]